MTRVPPSPSDSRVDVLAVHGRWSVEVCRAALTRALGGGFVLVDQTASWASWRDLHDLDAGVNQDGVARGGEPSSPVTDEEPEVVGSVVEDHEQVTGLLGGSGPVGMGGAAAEGEMSQVFSAGSQ